MLEATGLVKRYGQVTALDGFTLSVAAGEITGLVGHNGAGKTTFTRIIAGLTAPDAGHVTIAGLPPRRAARLIGVAPQAISLYPAVTVRESLRVFGGLHGLRRSPLAAAVAEVTDELCLGGFLDQRIVSLSGGQQRRAQAAVALLHRPPLVLLDEPTAGVDPTTRQALLAALRQRAADGAAILYTTHYLPELADLQATLAVARGGRVIARGTAQQLLSGLPGQVTLDLGDEVLRVASTDTAATLARLLTTISKPLRGVSVTEPSLDWAARTGELSANTAAGYKTAVTRVLEIDGEAWTDTSIRELDVTRQMDRFARLRASRYNPTSLRTYGNRLSAAVTHYLKYLDDPATFRAAHPGTPRAKVSDKAKAARPTARDGSGTAVEADIAWTGAGRAVSGDLVQYPFPLRAGVMAYFSLPRDLSRTEAQRIAAFVASLAIDPAGSAEVHGQGDS